MKINNKKYLNISMKSSFYCALSINLTHLISINILNISFNEINYLSITCSSIILCFAGTGLYIIIRKLRFPNLFFYLIITTLSLLNSCIIINNTPLIKFNQLIIIIHSTTAILIITIIPYLTNKSIIE